MSALRNFDLHPVTRETILGLSDKNNPPVFSSKGVVKEGSPNPMEVKVETLSRVDRNGMVIYEVFEVRAGLVSKAFAKKVFAESPRNWARKNWQPF